MFFYRLGHIPLLALSEFESVVGKNKILDFDQFFLQSENEVNVNEFGSLVFRAKIIEKIKKENLENDLADLIANYVKINGLKKIGLNIHKKYQKDLLKKVKAAGGKKINVTFKNELNFGDFKQSKNWIQLIYFKNEIFLVHLNNFSNQEFWSKLDFSLPHNDLKRGIINLKLARSLFNLAHAPKVWWDPFVGQGRLLAANLDKTEDFYGSDIDENVLNEARENVEFSQNYFKWNQKFLFSENEIKSLDTETDFFQQDIKLALHESVLAKTVVTEGYLGQTLHSHPNDMRAKEEIKLVENIWINGLKNLENTGIHTVVACFPFYPQIRKMDDQYFEGILKNIIKSSKANFKIVPFFQDKTFIRYTRKESFTGHLIFRLIKP